MAIPSSEFAQPRGSTGLRTERYSDRAGLDSNCVAETPFHGIDREAELITDERAAASRPETGRAGGATCGYSQQTSISLPLTAADSDDATHYIPPRRRVSRRNGCYAPS